MAGHEQPLTLPSPTDPFIRTIRRTIRERRLLSRGDAVVVACSGGADSTALLVTLAILAEDLDVRVSVAHVHHRLRGADADEDARWVARCARTLGLPFHLSVADIPVLKRERGGSVEEVARWARRLVLETVLRDTGADVLATAHHADDQAETILMHLLRGSGLTGLAGMTWGPEGGTIRPFLGVRRQEVRSALRRWGIEWREDATNDSLDMARNRVRHRLLPYLEREWNPQIIPTLARQADIIAADDRALEERVNEVWTATVRRASGEMVLLDNIALRSYPLGIRRRLVRRAAHGLRSVATPLSSAETERLVALTERTGQVALRRRMTAWSTEAQLRLEAADAWCGPTTASLDGVTVVPHWGRLSVTSTASPPDAPNTATALRWPEKGINPPVVIRRWQAGDRITRKGGKSALVADIARKRTPPADPRALVVIADTERIVWVPGVAGADVLETPEGAPTLMLKWEWERGAEGL